MWLKRVTITKVFDCWRNFIKLAEDGWYDFCSLPYGVKQLMNLPDEDTMLQIPAHYNGICNVFLTVDTWGCHKTEAVKQPCIMYVYPLFF